MRDCIEERKDTAVIPVDLHSATVEISQDTPEHYTQATVHIVAQCAVKHSQEIVIYKIMSNLIQIGENLFAMSAARHRSLALLCECTKRCTKTSVNTSVWNADPGLKDPASCELMSRFTREKRHSIVDVGEHSGCGVN